MTVDGRTFARGLFRIYLTILENPAGPYGLGLMMVIIALAARILLLPMNDGFGYLTFYPAMMLSAILLGVGPGIVVIVLGGWLGFYVFTPPIMVVKLTAPCVLPLLVYSLSGAIICWIVSKNRAQESKLSLLAAIVQSSDNAIVSKTLNGIITSWNPQAEKLFGFTADEAIGKPMTIIFPPDRLDEEDILLDKIQKGEIVSRYETVRRRKDGSLVDVSVNLSPIHNRFGKIVGASKITHDITRRKQIDALLLSERKLLQATLDTLEEHVCVIDQTGVILSVNQRWLDFAHQNGGDPQKVGIGVNYLEVCDRASGMYSDEARIIAQGIRAVLRGHSFGFKLEYPCDSLTDKRWFQINVLRTNSPITRLVISHQDITNSKQFENHLRDLAFHDPLTRLPNRRLLLDRLGQAILNSKRQNSHLAVLYLDLNKFKLLNDTYGHEAGDMLLIEVAKRLLGQVRDTDTVARIGGDEFIVLLEGLGSDLNAATAYADEIAAKIHQSLSQEYNLGDVRYFTSASIGSRLCLGSENDPDQIIKDADSAMYQAKQRGYVGL